MTRASALWNTVLQGASVGFAVGLFEAIGNASRPITTGHAVEMMLRPAVAYAVVAVVLSLPIALPLLWRHRRGAASVGLAVGFALLHGARTGQSVDLQGSVWIVLWRLLLALVPYIVLGVAIGLLASRVSLLRRPLWTTAVAVILLAMALARMQSAPVHGMPGWLASAPAVLIGPTLLGVLLALRWRWLGRSLVIGAGVVALGMFALVARPPTLPRTEVDAPNVVLVTIDTLRADRVGAYGYERAQTPNLDALAGEGLQFEQAVTPIPLTTPAHASMLTGLMPVSHGSRKNWSPVSPGVPTIGSRLRELGYRTGAFVSALVLTDALCGLASHFDHYDDDLSGGDLSDRHKTVPLMRMYGKFLRRRGIEAWRVERRADLTTDQALRWLDGHQDAPFFLWVHYYDPHEPYSPPLPWARRFAPDLKQRPAGNWYQGLSYAQKEQMVKKGDYIEALKLLYDAEIAFVDHQVGRLIDALDGHGHGDDTILIVTSDHGEGLGEHDFYFAHGNYLYEEELRVPLLMRLPEGEPRQRKIPAAVSLIDLAPTVLDYVGIPDSFPVEGQSLRPWIEGQPPEPARPTYHGVRPGAWDTNRSIYAVRTPSHKLIWTGPEWRYKGMRVEGEPEFYNLVEDPGELNNLFAQDPPAMSVLGALLREYRSRQGVKSLSVEPDAEMMRKLEALGYAGR